jgi:nucleotide-binding universal stress UspA family protein
MSSRTPHSGVVVGVDGSAASRMAVRWAVREAIMRNVPLTLVHAVRTGMVGSAAVGWPAASTLAELAQRQKDEGRQVIADAVEIVEDSAHDGEGPEVNSELFDAPPVPTLVDLSKEARMVVVGCRGHGAFGRALLGSVSTGLVHHARCPVAVIHDDARTWRRPNTLPVVVGIDGSPASELATAIAFDEASWRGVDLVAVHAWSDANMLALPSRDWLELESSADETLAERLAGFQERYPEVIVQRLIVWDQPARHLLDQSESAQLVVVGSHGRGGFAGMLLGSVSAAVVHGARTPVIVARQS